ncbi:MAG TPA: endonuclease/exonuclease/phosphatase family protein [Kiritimatiellia bacterium]|jgi:endonuclease/exonuclease/phosphatase family metal-dependent hydrolase|nr:endonuclease/exonuclease/phosphatase family protein [Kiritimatiellia bacterium]HOM58301.1 endonuclease/exonuclease/phosphatase family protein [Kiritimatiellia bacterium]HOR96874.1 endonuclease/exonuclease/phosphatase family protein [Kiritimatiellia bacterium]HPC49209.1 endonuclease/exonuclease/phosphatase family protein [Kiritimatiellia bacterium]HPK37115.1 endonuclease/exonuclease/phosphatase family protein [Kiritimatiellia bacterium]
MRLLLHNIQYGTGRLRRFAWVETLLRTTAHFPNITRFVRHMNPDIVGLVEVDAGSYRARHRNQAEELAADLSLYHCCRVKYPDEGMGRRLPVFNKQANAVLVREPILRTRFHDFETGFKSLAIEVELENVTFFLVHLALGIRARQRQLSDLYDLITGCDKPRLVAGDFNTLSGVWEMRMFLRATGLRSANTRHAPTFPSWAPCRELDFICYDPSIITPVRFKIPRVRLSDHLPLMFDFEIGGGRIRAPGDGGH